MTREEIKRAEEMAVEKERQLMMEHRVAMSHRRQDNLNRYLVGMCDEYGDKIGLDGSVAAYFGEQFSLRKYIADCGLHIPTIEELVNLSASLGHRMTEADVRARLAELGLLS
jgi:hypothetical protein